MAKKRGQRYKACRNCKLIVEYTEKKCPNCGSTEFSEEYIGEIIIINSDKSEISKKIGIKEGIWAIRIL